MKVWVLERFCTDDCSYDFEGKIFTERDKAIDFVFREYETDWRIQNETETVTEMWIADVWEVERKTRHDVATFIITACEVQ
jgi:hypothetical protein